MVRGILPVLLSALLLIISFPPFDFSYAAWIALVPLLLITTGKGQRFSFLLSLICGCTFILGVFKWILEVVNYTYLHHALLVIYLGSYVAVFGLLTNWIARRISAAWALWTAPFIWVVLEYIRSHFFFIALPWGLLSHSQYQCPSVIQIASVTGAYGVSFLIVLVNSAVTAILLLVNSGLAKNLLPHINSVPRRAAFGLAGTAAACTALTLIFGFRTISRPIQGEHIKISVVQGDIEQTQKWDHKYAAYIMQTYRDLTLQAARDKPDLIVWPETATPGSVNRNLSLHRQLTGLSKQAGAYLLVGRAQQQKFRSKGPKQAKFYNSAFLIGPKGKLRHYNKIRLFPFGEYLPMKGIIPWSFIHVPAIDGYVSGKEYTVFDLPPGKFGVTICWENIFPNFVRQFTKRGAGFIINITNEAWFGDSAAPYQFLSMSVLRAAENRVSVIRSANTGISCFIDPYGRVLGRVENDQHKPVFVRGFLTREVPVRTATTFYARRGDVFAYACAFISTIIVAVLMFDRVRRLILK